ncbi:protein translocase subunit SecD [Caminibacter mediatlanticus TB-2]|uniref:Protein translocase subunit SecD n=1 Tax=Caminibacter mediatlanticus TB-2 TaxID=391592 RepID=A0AAI9AH92_9BACT|nr:protein translocase subunit SecD [Caminibacter mediatlanticus]EDM23475.1 protein export protein SecD [Caminibacter mediatlanticus TB-2]QCT94046.1 protein translocase subunit SecD [Caminibacter mediatlanticus TB-2]
MKKLNYRLVIFILATLFGIAFTIPSFLGKNPKVNLGLDLQGGMYLVLGVKQEDAIKNKIKTIASTIKYISEKKELFIDNLKVKNNKIEFELIDNGDEKAMDKELATIKGINIKKIPKNGSIEYIVSLKPEEIEKTKEDAIKLAVQTIRSRLDAYGLAEPSVTRQGKDKIVVELPGIKTQKEKESIKKLISSAAHLELYLVDDERKITSPKEAAKYGDILLPDKNNPNKMWLLKTPPVLDGSMITNATVGFTQKTNQPAIFFTLNSQGAKIFGDVTGKNVGKRLAIVVDNKVYSAPVIQERIGGGSGQITVGSPEEAHILAIALRSGSLPAPVVLLEQRSVGASLGADSIRNSMIALISGFVIVVLFMAWYYRLAGIIADIALITNLFLIISIMALFGATLTLPGMAGIVLTVGMAVDANVIINERIRELIREGVPIRKAIEGGYKNAMSAILDANITTLIAAIALFAYGTGTIKGFAITMAIGILASMLTAILGTHGIWQFLLDMGKKITPKDFGMKV